MVPEEDISLSFFHSADHTCGKVSSLLSESDFFQFVSKLNSDIQENLSGRSVFPSSMPFSLIHHPPEGTLDETLCFDSCLTKSIQFPDSPLSVPSTAHSSSGSPLLEVTSLEEVRPAKCPKKKVVDIDLNTFWTDENIKKMFEWTKQFRQDWKKVAKKFQMKQVTPTMVRNKYRELKNNELPLWRKFTYEEDMIIAKYYSIYGFQWKKIAEHLKSRTHIMVKNRFYSHIKKRNLIETLVREADEKFNLGVKPWN